MIEFLIISAIILWALLYSAWSLMPAGARRALAQQAAAWARKLGFGERQVQGMQARLTRSGGCSDCSSCPGCRTPAAVKPDDVDKDLASH